jgi:type II secretion system protein I
MCSPSEKIAYGVQRIAYSKVKSCSLFAVRCSLGFTLVEALVAIAILATGLMLVIEGMGRTEQALRIADNLVTASQIAEKKLIETELDILELHRLSMKTEEGKEKLPGRL